MFWGVFLGYSGWALPLQIEKEEQAAAEKAVTKEEFQTEWTAPAPEFTAPPQPEVADWSEGVQVPSVPIQQFPTGQLGQVSVGRGGGCCGWKELGSPKCCCVCDCRGLECPACHRGLVSSSYSPGYRVGWHCHGVVLTSALLYCERNKGWFSTRCAGTASVKVLADDAWVAWGTVLRQERVVLHPAGWSWGLWALSLPAAARWAAPPVCVCVRG